MPRIDVPPDRDPMIYLWTERAAPLTSAAARFSNTAYYQSTLSPREFEIVREINAQGTPVLLVEQNALMALDTANRGYVMETGRITLHGPADELKANERVQKAYLGLE